MADPAASSFLVDTWLIYRVPLFTAFLTMGGILFTITSFLLTNLTKEMYASEAYVKRVAAYRKAGGSPSVYGPLIRLKRCLFHSIWASLGAAILILAVGFLTNRPYLIVACLIACAYGLFRVLWAVYRFWSAVVDFIKFKEEIAEKEIIEINK